MTMRDGEDRRGERVEPAAASRRAAAQRPRGRRRRARAAPRRRLAAARTPRAPRASPPRPRPRAPAAPPSRAPSPPRRAPSPGAARSATRARSSLVLQVGAQQGARAVDAGADRADGHARGVRRSPCRSGPPRRAAAARRGRRRRRCAGRRRARGRARAPRRGPSASSVKSASTRGGQAAAARRVAEVAPHQVGGDAVQPRRARRRSARRSGRARRRPRGTSRRRGPRPPGRRGARSSGGSRRQWRSKTAANADPSRQRRGDQRRVGRAQRMVDHWPLIASGDAKRFTEIRQEVVPCANSLPLVLGVEPPLGRRQLAPAVHDVARRPARARRPRSSPARSGPADRRSCSPRPRAASVWIAQPSEESSSVAATPPCTDPIGLYIHSAGVTAKITRPSSTSVISKSSSWAIGGGGSSPAAIFGSPRGRRATPRRRPSRAGPTT